jgi:hypothetical protein
MYNIALYIIHTHTFTHTHTKTHTQTHTHTHTYTQNLNEGRLQIMFAHEVREAQRVVDKPLRLVKKTLSLRLCI